MISYDIVEHGKPLQRAIRETPTPTGTEVLVRITHSGVCHSDLHIWDGFFDWGDGKRFYVKDRGCVPPFTLGHEPFGEVAAVGPEATGVMVGEPRLVYPWIGCGRCALCESNRDNFCVTGPRYLGIARNGAYATHVIVPHPKYLLDVGSIDRSFAATLACSALTVYSATNKLTAGTSDDWLAVLGCGGLGLNALSMLRAKGFKRIVAVDVDDDKLKVARDYGAIEIVNSRTEEGPARLNAITGGNLAGAIDLVGMPQTAKLAIDALRKGGQYVLCGLYGGEFRYPMPPIAQRSISIIGSFVGSLGELRDVVTLAREGKIVAPPIQNRPASAASTSLEELKAGHVSGRVVLNFATEA